MSSPEMFNASLYDLAEEIVMNEFICLVNIVHHTKACWEYKKGNELDRYYRIIANILELILDEDPENFYAETEHQGIIKPSNNINSVSTNPL